MAAFQPSSDDDYPFYQLPLRNGLIMTPDPPEQDRLASVQALMASRVMAVPGVALTFLN